MATDVTVLNEDIQKALFSTVFAADTLITSVASVHVNGSSALEIQDMDGLAKFSQQSGATDITATDARAFKSRSNPVVLEARTALTNKEVRDILSGKGFDIFDIFSRMFGANMLRKMAKDVFTLYASGRVTAHPENGVSGSPLAAVGGGTLYAVDNITTTPINTPSSPFDQTNDFTLAFNSANVNTILAYRSKWKSRDGDNNVDPNIRPRIITAPDLTKRARDLFSRQGEIYDGTGLQSGHAGEVIEVVQDPSGAFASDAFAFVYQSMKLNPTLGSVEMMFPVHLHVNVLPTMKLTPAEKGNYSSLVAEVEYDAFYDPMVDRDLLYSEP